MADSKISALSDSSPAATGDQVPINRSGTTGRITWPQALETTSSPTFNSITLKAGTGTGAPTAMGKLTINTTAVGTTTAGPDDLMTYTMPLNSFSAAGKGVHITVWGTTLNNAETKSLILYFGTQAILTNALTASIAGVWRIDADVFSTGTDTQDYVAQLATTGTAGVALNDIEAGSATQDDGATITIKCTGTIGAPSTANGIVQEGFLVNFLN